MVGVLTWRPERDADAVELSVLIAEPRGGGTGTALIAALAAEIVANGRHRIRVVTTNDNIDALRFYQRRGFRLVELRPGAVDVARATLKPGIPAIGGHGIPLRDELELELDVDTDPGEPSRV